MQNQTLKSQTSQPDNPPDRNRRKMDLSDIAKKLGLSEPKHLIRKAAELRRLCDVQFDSSIIGVVSFTSILIQTKEMKMNVDVGKRMFSAD
jgi:hypothetical protein